MVRRSQRGRPRHDGPCGARPEDCFKHGQCPGGDAFQSHPLAEKLAKPLLTKLSTRVGFVTRLLPVIGAVTGASYNTQMINSVAAVAQQVFRTAYEQQYGLDRAIDPEQSQPVPISSASLNTDVAALSADELVKGVFGKTAAEVTEAAQNHTEKTKVIRVTKTADGEIVPSGRA